MTPKTLPKAGDLYPWTLHKADAQTKTVWNDEEKAAAEADGWCVNPADVTHDPPVDAPPVADAPPVRKRR